MFASLEIALGNLGSVLLSPPGIVDSTGFHSKMMKQTKRFPRESVKTRLQPFSPQLGGARSLLFLVENKLTPQLEFVESTDPREE